MSVRKPLGQYLDLQKEAAEILQSGERMTYDELKAELEIDNERMQAVIRGLSDNGLLNKETIESGLRKYYVPESENPERLVEDQ